jgi:membrane fusion protein
MSSLFRREAIENHQSQWLGSIRLVRPVSLSVLVALVLACAVTVALYMSFGHYTRKARITGFLMPDSGIVRLLPTQSGTVLERRVNEGQSVHAGDVLFVLSVDQATNSGDTQAAVKQSLKERSRSLRDTSDERARLLAQQQQALDRRLADMRRELGQMAAEADLHRQRLVLAEAQQARLESLRAENFISPAQVQSKAEDVLALKAQLQALDRQRAAQMREIGTVEAERRDLPLQAQVQQGEIDRDLAAIDQQSAESDARRHLVVRAPQDGVLTAVIADPGQSVTPNAALASLIPAHAQLQAQLFAPSSAVGFLRADQPVQLRYEAYPFQKFGHQAGHILQVSRTPLQSSELAALPLPGTVSGTSLGATGEPLYRITVALDRQSVEAYGHAEPLAPGMQLEADVMLDRRRLIEWIFEPLLSVVGRV